MIHRSQGLLWRSLMYPWSDMANTWIWDFGIPSSLISRVGQQHCFILLCSLDGRKHWRHTVPLSYLKIECCAGKQAFWQGRRSPLGAIWIALPEFHQNPAKNSQSWRDETQSNMGDVSPGSGVKSVSSLLTWHHRDKHAQMVAVPMKPLGIGFCMSGKPRPPAPFTCS